MIEDGINCIFKDNPIQADGKVEYISYHTKCGKDVTAFILDLEHAENCIKMGTWVQPCEKCLEIARGEVVK